MGWELAALGILVFYTTLISVCIGIGYWCGMMDERKKWKDK